MVGGKRPRADQAHIAAYDVPKLRKLVEAHSPQKVSDDGKHAWIAGELEVTLPFCVGARIARKVLLQTLLGVNVHRAKLEYAYRLSVASDAFLNIQRRAWIDELDAERQDDDCRPQ